MNTTLHYGGLLHEVPTAFRTKPGVYIISPYSNPAVKNTSRVKVKIGLAKHNLYQRIDSYHTAQPDSFWIYSVITTSNEAGAIELEKYLHKVFAKFRYKNAEYEARTYGEWFKVRKARLRNDLNKAIRDKWNLIRGLLKYSKKDTISSCRCRSSSWRT